jgi:hypothetical protein
MDIFNKRAVSNIDHGLILGRREIVRAEIYQERIAAPVEWGPITLHMATISECRYRWLRGRARRRFPVGASPTRHPLQPEATGAGMEVTKCLKPLDSGRDLVTVRVCRPQRE